MKAYTETERLIRLLKEADKNASDKLITDYEEAVADNAEYLLARGVIAPPCRVGDKLYEICEGIDDDIPTLIEEHTVTEVGTSRIFCSAYVPPRDDIHNELPIKELGRSLFLTRDEAERALHDR